VDPCRGLRRPDHRWHQVRSPAMRCSIPGWSRPGRSSTRRACSSCSRRSSSMRTSLMAHPSSLPTRHPRLSRRGRARKDREIRDVGRPPPVMAAPAGTSPRDRITPTGREVQLREMGAEPAGKRRTPGRAMDWADAQHLPTGMIQSGMVASPTAAAGRGRPRHPCAPAASGGRRPISRAERGGRAAEGARLESVYTVQSARLRSEAKSAT
jgi:hypothetical protein